MSLREYTEDTLSSFQFLAIANSMKDDFTDTEVNRMLKYAESGSQFLLGSHQFNKKLLDTLGLSLQSFLYEGPASPPSNFSLYDFFAKDTLLIRTENTRFPRREFVMRRADLEGYFTEADTARTTILATTENKPIAVKVQHGKGSIILVSNPYVFSNVYLLQGNNLDLMTYFMSFLSDDRLVWTEFYQVGPAASSTPLRYILGEPALKWALYISLSALFLFVLFEAKRKQRAIPVLDPTPNDSLQFVTTIGNLYFEKKDNRGIAKKRIQFFREFLRTNYLLNFQNADGDFTEKLRRKSGQPLETCKKLVDQITYIESGGKVSDGLLISLSGNIELFYN